MSANIDIRTTIRGQVPRIPFAPMAKDVLGASYELSLVVCGDALSRKINRAYRKKDYSPNVLSFELQKNAGEIFLNLRKAERESRTYRTSLQKRVALLYVHGLFHLKGLDHGEKMEREESRILSKYGLQ